MKLLYLKGASTSLREIKSIMNYFEDYGMEIN